MATPSGLNNIPTADVTPPGVLVWQAFTNLGPDQPGVLVTGFKYGVLENLEIGIDDRLHRWNTGLGVTGAGGAPAGPAVLQLKYRGPSRGPLAWGVGLANLSSDTNTAGQPVPYAVLSYAAGPRLRLHAGHAAQAGNPAWFAGLDHPLGRALLRADWTQTDDGRESVASLGALAPVTQQWVMEGWVSWPSADGAATTYTLKVNLVLGR